MAVMLQKCYRVLYPAEKINGGPGTMLFTIHTLMSATSQPAVTCVTNTHHGSPVQLQAFTCIVLVHCNVVSCSPPHAVFMVPMQ